MIKNIIISITIITIAAFTIYPFFDQTALGDNDYPVLLNAGIGLFGVLLLIGRSALSGFFIFLWIMLQLAVVRLPSELVIDLSSLGLQTMSLAEVNFTQHFTYFLQEPVLHIDGYVVGFNLLPLLYLLILFIPTPTGTPKKVGVRVIEANGETYELKLFRWNKLMEHITPQRVEVIQKMDFRDSKNWLLVRLAKPIKFKNGRVIYNALIKPKDEKKFIKNQPGQLGYFRLLKDRRALREGRLDLQNTSFVDWVFVK